MGGFWTLLKTHLKEWFFDILAYLRSMGDQLLGTALVQCQSLIPTVNWSSVQDRLDQINYFFPLSECVAYATALFALWSLVMIYRIVKTWIPLVGS